jgi:glycosyltransferase involved in cell wall biosynthesis/GT2 family glycosyltransferase
MKISKTFRRIERFGSRSRNWLNRQASYFHWDVSAGRLPRRRTREEVIANELRDHFNANYYRRTNPDIIGSDAELLAHFISRGWREGRDPTRTFSCEEYLQNHPDVAEAGINPFLHFIRFGKQEGRTSMPSSLVAGPTPEDFEVVRPHFDFDFYRSMNTDLEGTDEELLKHFMHRGWKEWRDPNAEFSCAFYLEAYQDIARNGANPFLHYILFGKSEKRRPNGEAAKRLGVSANAKLTPPALSSVTWTPAPNARLPRPPASVNPGSLRLHWVIPDFARGSGGHMTIFRTIRLLELLGHRSKIWIEKKAMHKDAEEAWEDIVKNFQCVEAEVDFVENGFFEAVGDAVIATGWSTAYLAHKATGFAGKFYFVQDHEPEFYPTGSEALLARHTYALGLNCICASPWLDQIMRDRYGLWARHFFLAYDPDIYRIRDAQAHAALFAPKQPGKKKIAVYAREHTARRCVELALMALEQMSVDRDDFEVHFFGQDQLRFNDAPFLAYNHGILDPEKLSRLYSECHVGICFSGTNYSLVPQEMMACGLPVLELNVESTRAIFPQGVVTLAGPEPGDIAQKLAHMLDDASAREKQAQTALEWVGGFSWEGAAKAVEAALRERLGELVPMVAPSLVGLRAAELDVVIPTWNGMGELEPVIEALARQHDAGRVQIHCIDSSSTDGTIEWLRKRSDVSLTVIDQKDFQHGRTRNQGASLGHAPLIGFLTQDAMPANPFWATDILKMFNRVPEAAGLFGRHLPYPHHPEAVRDEIDRHFANMLKHPLVLSKDTDPERWASGNRGWRQLLHFYSDNNSAMRRKIWEEFPYAEVDYGEDQIWARDIIEAGFSKIYAPTAIVYHSHDYDPAETYKRAHTEGAFFYTHFGYELGVGTEEELTKRIEREQGTFMNWARQRKLAPAEIRQRRENIRAKHRGWRDGRLAALDQQAERKEG